ncbi:MAG: hypothetical protein ACM3VW_10540 [Bacteroidota bacterium]
MPLLVRRSRLKVSSDRVRFPAVSGSNLNREELEFPRDFRGALNLLFVPFLQSQQTIVNTWIPFADQLESSLPELAYYELPTINELPALSRTFINEGMRAGIPNAKARARTVTLYIDTAKFMGALGIPSKEEVHVLLVDRGGEILWRTTGSFDEAKGSALAGAIEIHLGRPEASRREGNMPAARDEDASPDA